MNDQWLTMSEYARQHGISREAVRRAVKAGRIEHNGKTGRECRVRGDLAESSRIIVAPNRSEKALTDIKLEKLRADIDYQRQRIKETREAMRRNVAEIFIEEYIRAFAPVKAGLTALRLDAASLAALRKLIDTCTTEFTASFRKRVIEGE